MSSPANSNNSGNSEKADDRSVSSASTTEEKRRLDEALKKRRELIERIKEERAKVVGLSRLAALKEDGRESQQPQQQPTTQPQQPLFPPIINTGHLQLPQTGLILPFSQTKGDWKKAIMEMSTFQSLALQQTLAQQVALRNLVCLQRRQASAPPGLAVATTSSNLATTTTFVNQQEKREKPSGLTATQMIELLKGTKNLEIRQEPNGHWQIGTKGNRCHHHCCHGQPQQLEPVPQIIQQPPVPQYMPPPPPPQAARHRPPSVEEEEITPRRRRQRARRRSPLPESPEPVVRERIIRERQQPQQPIRVEVNVPNQQPTPQIIQQPTPQQQQQNPINIPYPVQQQQQPQQQQPIYLPGPQQPQQPQQTVIYQREQRRYKDEEPRRRHRHRKSSSSSSSSSSSKSTSESEEETTTRRVTFRLNKQKEQPAAEQFETPVRRKHRIRAKIANLMWPGIGISWWMRNAVVKALRRSFYVAWYYGCIRRTLEMKGIIHEPQIADGIPDYLTFEICLKDIASSVISVYLNMHGAVRPLIDSLLAGDAIDLRAAFTRGSEAALKEIKYLIENICFQITDIQPSTGALGTHKKGMLQQLISEGQLFPPNELWQFERDRLGFDYSGRTMAIGDREAMMLIIRVFFRPLMNLMINPVGFNWAQQTPNPPQAASLRIMVSIFCYIYRRAITPRNAASNNISIPVVPEIGPYLIPDATLTPVLNELQSTLDYVDNLLREWALSYVKRLRLAALGLTVPPNYVSKEFGGTEPFILVPDPPALPPPG